MIFSGDFGLGGAGPPAAEGLLTANAWAKLAAAREVCVQTHVIMVMCVFWCVCLHFCSYSLFFEDTDGSWMVQLHFLHSAHGSCYATTIDVALMCKIRMTPCMEGRPDLDCRRYCLPKHARGCCVRVNVE